MRLTALLSKHKNLLLVYITLETTMLNNFEEQIWQQLSSAPIQTITTTGTISQNNGHQNGNRNK